MLKCSWWWGQLLTVLFLLNALGHCIFQRRSNSFLDAKKISLHGILVITTQIMTVQATKQLWTSCIFLIENFNRIQFPLTPCWTCTVCVHSFDAIILHVGTNKCTSDTDVDAGAKDLDVLLYSLNQRAPNTVKVVSSIIPRRDSKEHPIRMDKLNAKLADSEKTSGCIFIDNDMNFKLRNGDIDNLTPRSITKVFAYLVSAQAGYFKTLTHHTTFYPLRMLLYPSLQIHNHLDIDTETIAREQPRERETSYRYRRPHHHQTYNRHQRDYDSHQARYQKSQQHQSRQRQREYDGCHFCGSLSHTRRNCRYGEEVQCYECSEYGHLSYFCKFRNVRRWDPGQVLCADMRPGNIESHNMYTILSDELECIDDNTDDHNTNILSDMTCSSSVAGVRDLLRKEDSVCLGYG